MKLITRFAYYSVGLFFESSFLFSFLVVSEPPATIHPMIECLKIFDKKICYNSETIHKLKAAQIDTADMRKAFHTGNVDFGASNTSLDSCKLYVIDAKIEHNNLRIKVEIVLKSQNNRGRNKIKICYLFYRSILDFFLSL